MAKPNPSAKHAPESKTASPAAAKEAASPAAAKAGKKPRSGKPSTWRKLDSQLARLEKLRVRIKAVAVAVESSPTPAAPVGGKLATAMASLVSGILEAHNALQWLDAEEVPAIKPPAAPKFSVGDAVRVTKKALSRYTRSGLYSAEFLADMVVDKVSASGKEFLCRDPEGAESVHVRYGKHLERVG